MPAPATTMRTRWSRRSLRARYAMANATNAYSRVFLDHVRRARDRSEANTVLIRQTLSQIPNSQPNVRPTNHWGRVRQMLTRNARHKTEEAISARALEKATEIGRIVPA